MPLIEAFKRVRKWEMKRQYALQYSLSYGLFALVLPGAIFVLFVGVFGDWFAWMSAAQVNVFLLVWFGAFLAYFWYFGDYKD